MKKIITLFAALSLCASAYALMPEFGVRAGLNLTGLSNYSLPIPYSVLGETSYVPKPGFYVGVTSEFEGLFGPLDLRVEAYLSGQGQRARVKSENLVNNMKLTYINIPVLAQYQVLDDRISVFAGPQLGICLGGKNVIKTGNEETKTKLERGDYSTAEFGLVFGAGCDIAKGFGVDLRFNLGLTNALKDTDKTNANRCFQIGAYYKF